MELIDGHSGKRKFFKGRGQSGSTKLDDYQKMLLEGEKTNGFEKEEKQKPLTGLETAEELRERWFWKPNK